MMRVRRSSLAQWMTDLLSAGRVVFSLEEARRELGIGRGAFLDAAERLQRRGHLIRPRRGFYVIVPPQYLAWGAPPPSWYIDDLMRFEDCSYYVGLLKAAELHRATHQAVMEFQVVSDKRFPKIQLGRSVIAFYFRNEFEAIAAGVADHKTAAGRMKVSSPELTALDLVRYPHAAVGLDNIVTVLADLGDTLDATQLVLLSRGFERSVSQRLGYLLDFLGCGNQAGLLQGALSERRCSWIELDPAEAGDTEFAPDAVDRDSKWRVVVRRMPEVDQ